MRVMPAATRRVVRAVRSMRVVALMRVVAELGGSRIAIRQREERCGRDLDSTRDRRLRSAYAESCIDDLGLRCLGKNPGERNSQRRYQYRSPLHRAESIRRSRNVKQLDPFPQKCGDAATPILIRRPCLFVVDGRRSRERSSP